MNKSSQNTINPNLVFYWLLPIIGLGLPIIIYIFTYSPILTAEMADEISFARFLYANNSHSFAEGWNSTREFFPFSIRFFMSFFADTNTAWTDILYKSTLYCYLLFSAAFIFFTTSLHAQRLITYVITAISALLIGYYALIATYDCNNFITYFTFILLLAGFILHGIRIKKKLPIKIGIASVSVIILLFTMLYIGSLGKSYAFTTINFRTLASLFTSPLNPSKQLTDMSSEMSNVSGYLTSHNITDIYCTSDKTNILNVTTNSKVNAVYTNNLSTLELSKDTDRVLINSSDPVDISVSTVSEFPAAYILIDNTDYITYSDYLTYGTSIYTDEVCSIYRFNDTRILTDSLLRTDFSAFASSSYDTVILSMYDISTIDVNELYNTKLWNSYLASKVLSDISLLQTYNEQIFNDTLERYVFCVDPYQMYNAADNNYETYTECIRSLLGQKVETNPSIDFKFILPSYYIRHYENYNDSDFINMKIAYESFIDIVTEYPNSSLHFFGYQEYLYANPYLYMDGSYSAYTPDIANTLLKETLADNTHIKNADICKIYVNNFIEEIRKYPFDSEPTYNLSNTNIVILGDSIFGNYKDSTSIQSIVADYSGANIICRAIGGASAANIEGMDGYSLEHQINAAEINQSLKSDLNNIFVIEFGINDYFNGVIIDDRSNSHNTSTYCGAIRTAIDTINTNWPNSKIVLLIPGYVMVNDYGTVPFGNNVVLEEYRKAVISLSEEYDCECINLCEIGITKENCSEYLYGDQIHYNGRGRYLIGQYLLKHFTGNQ